MGGGTKTIPTTQDTKQENKLPPWMDQAGQKAVSIASNIADKPYQPYGGPLVAGLSPNTQSAIQYAGDTAGTGTGAINMGLDTTSQANSYARNAAGTGRGALAGAGSLFGAAGQAATRNRNAGSGFMGQAGDLGAVGNMVSANGIDAGQDEMGAVRRLLNSGESLAQGSQDTGRGAIDAGANLAGSLAPMAQGSVNAGGQEADFASVLARLSGRQAVGTSNAGGADLDAARGYTTDSARVISGDDISRLMNPYISQALDPARDAINRQASQNALAIGDKAAMRGSFGGSRQGILEGSNERNQLEQVGNLYKTGYKDAFDSAASRASDERSRSAGAAGLSLQTAAGANTNANDALTRLTQAGAANADAAGLKSELATQGQGRVRDAASAIGEAGARQSAQASDALSRLSQTGADARAGAATASGLTSDALARLTQSGDTARANAGLDNTLANSEQDRLTSAGQALQGQASAESGLASNDVERMLATVNPAYAGAEAEMKQVQATLANLVQTGQMDQQQAQNLLDTQYQQFLDQRDWTTNQLNALIATLSGTPYSTSSNSITHGQQIVQQPSMLGQIAGGAMAAASLASSDETAKEDIERVDDEAVLRRLASVPVSTYRYKEEHRGKIGDDGRVRIGPMAQEWGKAFRNEPDAKVIPMPEIMGALISSVAALERRTRKKAA